MARHNRSSQLETRTARLRLLRRKKPYTAPIGPGLRLGYRRLATAGTWSVLAADGKGGNWMKGFGPGVVADDYETADGDTVLDFWQAQDRARVVARQGRDGETPRIDAGKPVTVAEALTAYEADLKTRGGDISSVARVRLHLPAGISNKLVTLLSSRELRIWRDRLTKTLSPGSVNRIINSFRAALNLAAKHEEHINPRAWKVGLEALRNAVESRNVVVPERLIGRIVRAAYGIDAALGLLVEVQAVTGTRVSQAAKLRVEDLSTDTNHPRVMMPVSRKGRGQKKITHHPVPISADLAARLRLASQNMPADAPLLRRADGGRWVRNVHTRPFARVVEAAGLDPGVVTLAALRHSSITRMLIAGVPIRVVAAHHDTSITMIERTYSKHIGDHADALTRSALPDLSEPAADNVVALREG